MHSAILTRLRGGSAVSLGRIASGRASIVSAFDARTPHPLWIAKTARRPEDVQRLRNEYEALTYLAPWCRELGIPEVLEWEAAGGQAVLIQSGVRGRREKISLPINAGDADLRRSFQDALAWVRQFQAKVPLRAAMPAGTLAERYIEDLSRRSVFGGGLSGLMDVLRRHGAAGRRSAVPVHGDFHPTNVLFVRPGLSVVDWSAFGPGFPLQDAFSFLVNSDYSRRGHICHLIENYHHVFFSDSRVNGLVRQQMEADESSGDESRFLFYCFLATQICADAVTPPQYWLDIVRYLEPFEFPGPCTPLPAPRVE